MHPYRRLVVWQRSHQAALQIYRLTENFPKREHYGLAAQMRRAAISVPTNIAEGSQRATKRDFAHFINIAQASSVEVGYLAEVSTSLQITESTHSQPSIREYEEIASMLYALYRRLRNGP